MQLISSLSIYAFKVITVLLSSEKRSFLLLKSALAFQLTLAKLQEMAETGGASVKEMMDTGIKATSQDPEEKLMAKSSAEIENQLGALFKLV